MSATSSQAVPTDPVGTDGGWTPRLAFSAIVMILIIEGTTLGYTLVATALPQITQHYQTTQGGWLITAYVLAGAVCSPLVGKLADIHGKRRILLGCLAVSLVGAVVSAIAPVFWVLIIGRALQGLVITTLFLSYSLMRDVYPSRILPLATAVSMTGVGLFTIGTPFLIGAVLDSFGFRGLFAFDALWLVLLLPLLWISTPESAVRNRSRVDWGGAAALGIGLGVILVGVSFGSKWGWASFTTIGSFVVGLVLLAVFVLRSLRFPEPIVDLRIFTSRGILLAAVTAGAAYSCSGMFAAMSALVAQTPREYGGDYGLGLTAFQFGYLTAPLAVAMVLCGFLAGKLINRVGAASIMIAGLIGSVASGVVLAYAHDTFGQVMIAALLNGAAQGLSYAAIPALVIAGSPRDEQGSIAGMVQVSYSGIAAIFPVVLFVILGGYVTQASASGVLYQSAAFTAGGLFSAAVAAVAVLLGLTVLRVRREQGMIREEQVRAEMTRQEATA
jgi:MFS family permease